MKTAPVRDAQTPGVAAVERLGFARFGNLSGEHAPPKTQANGLSGLAAGRAADVRHGIVTGFDQVIVCIVISLDEQDQPEAIIG